MCGGAAGRDSTLIGSFGGDSSLNISFVAGEILELLDCLPSELRGYGWRPFVRPEDVVVTRLMVEHLQSGRAGVYRLRAQSRSGRDVLHMEIRTLIVTSALEPLTVRGVLDLHHCEPRRQFVLT